jgi:sensor domain CHASE-containing protein
MTSNLKNMKHMDSKLKEYLYIKLNYILQQIEDRDINGAIIQLEGLIKEVQYDQLGK